MDIIGSNQYRPDWFNEVTFLKATAMLSLIILLFYACKNFKITHTKYIRGKHVSFV